MSLGEALNEYVNEFHADINIDDQELKQLKDTLNVGSPTESSLLYQKGIHSLFMSVTRRLWSDYCKKYPKPNTKTGLLPAKPAIRITKKDGDVDFYRKENELLGLANLKLRALTEN